MHVEKYKSLAEAVEVSKERGFEGDFILDHDRLRHTTTNERFRPEQLTILEHYRFEGPSNPDDMSVLYLIQSNTGCKGTIIDAFGTYSDPDMAELLEKMDKLPSGA